MELVSFSISVITVVGTRDDIFLTKTELLFLNKAVIAHTNQTF